MKKITSKELVEILKNTTVESVGLVTETVVKMSKRGNPLADKNVTKITTGEFEFGGSYQERLNESFDSSLGTVTTKKLPWGHWVDGAEGKVILHEKFDSDGVMISSKYYLRYYNNIGDVDYQTMVDGVPASDSEKETVKEFITKKKETTYTTNEGNKIVSTVKTNVVEFGNIKSITIDGEEYSIED